MIEKLFSVFKNFIQFMKLKKNRDIKIKLYNYFYECNLFEIIQYNCVYYIVMWFVWICFYLLLINV